MSMNGGGGGNISQGGYGMGGAGVIMQQPPFNQQQQMGYSNQQQFGGYNNQMGFSQPAGYFGNQGGHPPQGSGRLGQSVNYNMQPMPNQQQMFGARYNQQASFQQPGRSADVSTRRNMFAAAQ